MVPSLGEVGDVPGSSAQGIFLSYGREDAAAYARLLQHELRERFPDARVFMDLDSIDPGRPFAEVIREAVESCAVLVALIGRQWLTLTDEEGQRRLDNPGDYVRFEVHTALERGVPVIPVLADGARPPRQQELPSELHKLAGLNALELSYARYEYDAGRLFDFIQRVLAPIRDREGADRRAQEETDHKAQQAEQRKARQAEQRKARQAEQRKARGEADRAAQAKAELRDRKEQAISTGEAGDVAGARDQLAALLPRYERSWGRTILTPRPPGTSLPGTPGRRGTRLPPGTSSPRCCRCVSGSLAPGTLRQWPPGTPLLAGPSRRRAIVGAVTSGPRMFAEA